MSEKSLAQNGQVLQEPDSSGTQSGTHGSRERPSPATDGLEASVSPELQQQTASVPADLGLFGTDRNPKKVCYDDRELALSESVSSNLSVDNLRDIRSYVQLPNIAQTLRTVHRSEFLPGLFRFQGKPYSLKGREPFKVLLNNEQPKKMLICAGRQISKCVSVAHLTKDNLHCLCHANGMSVTADTLAVGASVLTLSDDGRVVEGKISKVWRNTTRDSVRITTRTGRRIDCSDEHLVRLYETYRKAGNLKKGDRIACVRRGGIFLDRPMPESRIVMTAYMIGDGCCTCTKGTKNLLFTTASYEIQNEIIRFFPQYKNSFCTYKNRAARLLHINRNHTIATWLREDGLIGHYSYDKFVPDWVFDLSEEQTRLFMSRLWATDGMVRTGNGHWPVISYSTTSPRLARDVRTLLLKLGIFSTIKTQKAGYKNKAGVYKRCHDAHIVRVEGPENQRRFCDVLDIPNKPAIPVHDHLSGSNRDTLPNEARATIRSLFAGKNLYKCGLRLKPKYPLSRLNLAQYVHEAERLGLQGTPEYAELSGFLHGDILYDTVESVKRIGQQECFDIEVEGTHNFVLDGLVVHNSTSLAYTQVFDAISIPNFRILYVAPLEMQTLNFGNGYLTEALHSCELARRLQSRDLEGVFTDTKILTAVMHQSFANGSSIKLTYAKTSADRARGITADRIDFDEIQDQLIDNLPVITASLTTSEYQFERYTGTAKTVDNTIESLWQQSSMCEWVMRCPGCGMWNIPNEEGGVYDGGMIQADGLHCVKCDKKLNVYDGEWMATYDDRLSEFQGYHAPQVIFPFIVNNPSLWGRLVMNKIRQPRSAFMQETLGIACDVGSRILTQKDIDEHSLLPSMLELQKNLKRYTRFVGGIDWGGAEQESFTVHTILGIRADGRLDCVYAKRYQGFDPDEVLPSIAKAHRFYGCSSCAADYGMGFDKNILLQKLFGMRMCQMMFCHQNKLLSYSPTLGYPRWTVDKTTALDTLFMGIKNGRIFFPREGFETLTKDLLSPYEHVTDVGGLSRRRYLRNPNQPDDFCMALCFGSMLAMKLVYGSDNLDVIPDSAFNRGLTDDTPPDLTVLDPADVLTGL